MSESDATTPEVLDTEEPMVYAEPPPRPRRTLPSHVQTAVTWTIRCLTVYLPKRHYDHHHGFSLYTHPVSCCAIWTLMLLTVAGPGAHPDALQPAVLVFILGCLTMHPLVVCYTAACVYIAWLLLLRS